MPLNRVLVMDRHKLTHAARMNAEFNRTEAPTACAWTCSDHVSAQETQHVFTCLTSSEPNIFNGVAMIKLRSTCISLINQI